MLPRPKTASKNLQDFDPAIFNKSVNITGVAINAQAVKPGDLFIALPGSKTHGINYVDQAISNGAVAVLSDKAIDISLPIFISSNPRQLVGPLSAWIYQNPFSKLMSVGITGTNGKTTTAHLLNQIWQSSELTTGVIGTIGTEIAGKNFTGERTTPEACDLQAIAALMIENKVSHLAMEVSSHALVQGRLTGSHFQIAAFSNLTQDHLDFHESMDKYFAAKAILFTPELSDVAVINIDDSYGDKLSNQIKSKVITVSRSSKAGNWHFKSYLPIQTGFEIEIVNDEGRNISGTFNLLGEHNLDNLILAVAIAAASGLTDDQISKAIQKLKSVSGRLEQIELGQKFNALVDYAHTPDAVARVLIAARKFTSGNLIGILGCGGDRDKGKRPLMGEALINGADIAIFTSDNPRSESPAEILNQMVGQSKVTHPSTVIVDRKDAIAHAISIAKSGDTIMLLGKGHEVGQEIAGVITPFDDRIELSKQIKQVIQHD